MKYTIKRISIPIYTIFLCTILIISACNQPVAKKTTTEENIKKYTQTWDEIINNGKLELFNDSIFTKDVVFHEGAQDVKGIDSAKAYYANYLTGFSEISFTIKDVFGQDDKLVKYWNFKGKHTGDFFGIKATGKIVNMDGVTLVRMENGKIAEERDIMDNLEFEQQLGLLTR